mgnify:CR=1 FL=1
MAITTIYTYPLDGSTQDFQVPFEYLARRFVAVTLIGQDRKELVLTTDFRFTSKAYLRTNVAWGPANGYERIEIRRNTSATDRLVDFSDGSILRASELNISQVQTLHVAEEARNMVADTISENSDGDLDARGRRIANLADATEPGHAVTLRQQVAWAESALGSKDSAKISEVNSKSSENASKISEVNSKSSENAAKISEANSKASSEASWNSANESAWWADRSKTSAIEAKNSETNAQVSARSAAGYAAGLKLPSADGQAHRFLRQNQLATGLEYGPEAQRDLLDSTIGRLMGVGAFGIGGPAITLLPTDNLNNLRNGTAFYYSNGASGGVGTFYGWVLHVEASPGLYSYQMAFDISGKKWCRALNNGSWTDWYPDYNGFNVSETVRAFMVSPDSGGARAAIGASQRKRRRMVAEVLWSGLSATTAGISANPAIVPGDVIQFTTSDGAVTSATVVIATSLSHFATWGSSGYVKFTVTAGRLEWSAVPGIGVTSVLRQWIEE